MHRFTFVLLLVAAPASADLGGDWFAAVKAGKQAAATRLMVTAGLAYGDTGKDQTVATQVDRHLKKVLGKLRKRFGKATMEAGNCTQAARELNYLAMEWKEKDKTVADWIRDIPDKFCGLDTANPPRVWLVKMHTDDDVPHAIVVYAEGKSAVLKGLYHF